MQRLRGFVERAKLGILGGKKVHTESEAVHVYALRHIDT